MKLKVVHIAPTPFFSDRGCHIRIRNEIESLIGGKTTVILCTYHLGKSVPGIDTRRTQVIPGYKKLDAGFSPYKFVADILLFFLTMKTVWREKPDILHGHLHEGALIGWAVKCCLFWRQLPLIMDMQGSLSGELIGYGTLKKGGVFAWLVVGIERLICRMPQFFFCSSENSRNLLIERFDVPEERAILLKDVVPDAFFGMINKKSLRQEFGIPEKSTVIIYSGSLLFGKGIGHVLETIKELQHRQDLFFILIGYPVEDAKLYIDTHGLQESVLLQGRVAYCDLARWLAVADIALDPKEEATGEASGKILHYMAAGLPVICFDTANNRAILEDQGFYVKGNSHSFSQMIERVVKSRPEYEQRGRLGRQLIRGSYSLCTCKNILLQGYKYLISCAWFCILEFADFVPQLVS